MNLPVFILNGERISAKKLMVLGSLLSFCAFLFFSLPLVNSTTTSTATTTSNVTVNVYASISLSTAGNDFSGGVQFGSLDPSVSDQASTTCATYNCNITVGASSNVNLDIVIKDNVALSKGTSPTIPNVGYTWNSTDGTVMPIVTGSHAMLDDAAYDTTNKVGTNVAASAVRTWQAWLDIPAAQAAGNYNNSLSFCGEQTGTSGCT